MTDPKDKPKAVGLDEEKGRRAIVKILEGEIKGGYLADMDDFAELAEPSQVRDYLDILAGMIIKKLRPEIRELERAAQSKEFAKWIKAFMREGMFILGAEDVSEMMKVARRAAMERADKVLVDMVAAVKKDMWNDDWGVKGVIYEDMLDKIVEKYRKRLKSELMGEG